MSVRRTISCWMARPIGDLVHCPAAFRHATFELGAGGSVHEALERAGALPGIDQSGGEAAQEWIGRTDWCFSAVAELGADDLSHARVDLCFGAVDTLAELRVNGCRIGVTGNEFVPVRIPVKAWLQEGANLIEVRVRGPVAAVESLEARLGSRPVNGDWTPFPFLRKCAANFGWDWGPRSATAGVFDAAIECWDGARIVAVRPLVRSCTEAEARVEVHVEVEVAGSRVDPIVAVARLVLGPGTEPLTARIAVDERGKGVATMIVSRPARWWPRGLGEPALHPLRVVLESFDAEAWERAIGLRTVELLTTPDERGSRFAIAVNGQEVWCRGANWVPRRPCPRRVDSERLDALEASAAEAGLNMLRVWGGGIYESERFYEECDRRGILVWQDFMFACATYPEESPYRELIEQEARLQVTRLASHPSVVLWCGGNEDILAWWSWGWKERLREGQTWGRRYWLELLPSIVEELDPTRPYWPESPYSGSLDLHPNDPDRGDRHTWDAKLEAMRTIVPRFCSEFGHQSPPCWGSIRELLPRHRRVRGDGELASRQRAWGGDAFQYETHLAERFRPVSRLEDWVFAAHLLQARSYEASILWMRANAPRCMGALFWQLNDVWIGHSWSVLDARLRRKPAWFAVRRACAPQALTILPGDVEGGGRVVLCRAAGESGRGGVSGDLARLRLVAADGKVLADETLPLEADSEWRCSAAIPSSLLSPAHPNQVLLVGDHRIAGRAVHAFVPDKAFAFQQARFAIELAAGADEWIVRAESLVRDFCLAAPGDAFDGDEEGIGDPELAASDGCVTLLPGETIRISVPGSRPRDAACMRACARCANALAT